MSAAANPKRSRSALLLIGLVWLAFYATFTLAHPALLDDADSVHVEVAREMLLRHDFVTLYANGIRYLEKAPLLYWSMAACMRVAMLFGARSAQALATAARVPLSLTMLALALLVESFARRLFDSTKAGLYAALMLLSSFGLFIFTRITLPDAMVCIFDLLAVYAFWRMFVVTPQQSESQQPAPASPVVLPQRSEEQPAPAFPVVIPQRSEEQPASAFPVVIPQRSGGSCISSRHRSAHAALFGIACALGVLTKGLIGCVFPCLTVAIFCALTLNPAAIFRALRSKQLLIALLVFLAVAAPWHIAAALANPTQGHPAAFALVRQTWHGHWIVPLPSDGNVRGWTWFYFMNEHVLRYLGLRVPHDYDTSPLWLFWGLCIVWIMPWSGFAFHAVRSLCVPAWRARRRLSGQDAGVLLLTIAAALPLLFFALSTRQEYYVLPALPAMLVLLAGWLAGDREGAASTTAARHIRRANLRVTALWLAIGTLYAVPVAIYLAHATVFAPADMRHADLAALLSQNPSDYALSMGHFLDLTGPALRMFHPSLWLSASALFVGPLLSLLLRRSGRAHAATLTLAAGTLVFLLASWLAFAKFAPVLGSAQLAMQVRQTVKPGDLIVIHGEYESASTLGFYLQRPVGYTRSGHTQTAQGPIHILEGRSSNLWYGSFFTDAPQIFDSGAALSAKWHSPQRVFLWQATTDSDAPQQLPPGLSPVYVVASGGGKEILSNQPAR
jgi:4-amino-4-deoxy-L-arabinose transferase-like glycosyltransferase